MAILRYLLILFSAGMLWGCTEVFDPQIDTKPVLCLNSLITAGYPVDVQVTRTWLYNDSYSESHHDVSDAVVTIYANGDKVDDSYIAGEGDNIRIEAESPTFGNAWAEVTVPYAVPIGKVKFKPVITDIWKGNSNFQEDGMSADIWFNLNVNMGVPDIGDVENFYRFSYQGYDMSPEENPDDGLYNPFAPRLSVGSFEYNSEPIFKEHVSLFETVMGNDEYLDYYFFTDRQFSGKTYTLNLDFYNNRFRINSQDYDESLLECGIDLYLTSISRSYYNWMVYRWAVDEGILGDISTVGLAETQWGYSNVSTGAGVVAAQSSAVYRLSLKDFLINTFRHPPYPYY